MSINLLNGNDLFLKPSTTISVTQKKSLSDTDVISPSVSTIQPKIGNKSESEEQIKQAVQKIQEVVNNLAHNLLFSIDENTGRTIHKLMDARTEEVIQQIPTQEAIEIVLHWINYKDYYSATKHN